MPADDAKRSAGIATGAADDSALNAENAQKSALSAQQSAENAAASQSAAQASADAAEKSQQSAATDAKTANDSKVAAAGSEQAAGASEVKAAESEKAAKASEQAAAKSAQAALESKTAAATSEGNAAASAKKAQDVADSLPVDYTTAVNEIAALKTNKADKTELETVKQQVANITPDDSSIGDKPWSSKNIVDTLCPPLEESGNPVVCYPVAGYPLGVKAKWEPMQEGSGTPSTENIRPIRGRDSVTITRQEDNQVITLTLPETVYGGEVDAVRGEGNKNTKTITLDGNELKFNKRGIYYNLPNHSAPGILANGIICVSHFNRKLFGVNTTYEFCYLMESDLVGLFASIDDMNAYLAAQYAAGTPVQIAYKLAEPVPFTATGGGEIKALRGTNTLLTDADTLTVTGREDLIHAISELRAAQTTATKEE